MILQDHTRLTPLYQWGQADIADLGSDLHTPVGGTVTPSYVAKTGSTRDALIRLALSSYSGTAAFTIGSAITARRFRMRVVLYPNTSSPSGDAVVFGLCNGLTGSSFYAVAISHDTSGTGATLTSYEGATGWTAGAAVSSRILNSVIPSIYEIDWHMNSLTPGATGVASVVAVTSSSTGIAGQTQAYSLGDFSTETINRPFIGLNYALARTGNVEFAEFQILTHPQDQA